MRVKILWGIIFTVFMSCLLIFGFNSEGAEIAPPETKTYKVTIINNNPHSYLGITMYFKGDDGWDVVTLNNRWNDTSRYLIMRSVTIQ